MKYRRLISAMTLMAFVGCLLAMPTAAVAQDAWRNTSGGRDTGMNYWNRSWGDNNGFSQSGGGHILKRIIPGLLGGVAGFFLGSHFGPIGKIVGAAAGFFIANWVVSKLFPDRDKYSFNDYQNDYNFGYRNQTNYNQGYGYRGSETGGSTGGDGSLESLRDRYFDATRDYQDALRGGDSGAQAAARRSFEAARQAYFDGIQSNYR